MTIRSPWLTSGVCLSILMVATVVGAVSSSGGLAVLMIVLAVVCGLSAAGSFYMIGKDLDKPSDPES